MMAFDFSEQDLTRMLDAGDEEQYWAYFDPHPTWWGEETPAMFARGVAKELRAHRFHKSTFAKKRQQTVYAMHDMATSGQEQRFVKYVFGGTSWLKIWRRQDRRLKSTAHLEGLYEWEMRDAYFYEDYWDSDPEELQWREAYAHGDGSWEKWTPSHNPCHNDAMCAALWLAFQQAA